MIRIPFAEMYSTLLDLFLQYDFSNDKAETLARVHSESTLDGVRSHGINRVPLFIRYLTQGIIHKDAEATQIGIFGNLERWDGNLGPGIINASICTDRAIAIAKAHGIGLVALRNTNHWMRGGTYGKQAADAGCIGIHFTNTQANMPPWGGKDSRIGNNPFVIAIPRDEGHVILDMALSQFAFGKINDYKLKNEQLPYPGGWNDDDQLTTDPESILKKERGLPIGFWKGSGLSIVLDVLATILSAGDSTYRISQKTRETGISQIFICIDPEKFHDRELQHTLMNEIINYVHDVEPMNEGGRTYYPGEKSTANHNINSKEGIPVDEGIWAQILALKIKD